MSSRFTGRVAVVDLTAERAEATVEAIRSKGGQASYGCDATDQDAVEGTFACVDDELGGLHILVNNAGVTATACSSRCGGPMPVRSRGRPRSTWAATSTVPGG
ncbi:SDR family oxidoreductase [Streptomyces sp. NPDC005480]|uniref:SDR family oxidoreductase n=1 Tax=Streptomyces sp. NPDC005480 TaxID=3154880 RepID=UPI0033AC0DC6